MNFIQKLLGIDQLLLALSSVKSLQAELAEAKERNKQYEERNCTTQAAASTES